MYQKKNPHPSCPLPSQSVSGCADRQAHLRRARRRKPKRQLKASLRAQSFPSKAFLQEALDQQPSGPFPSALATGTAQLVGAASAHISRLRDSPSGTGSTPRPDARVPLALSLWDPGEGGGKETHKVSFPAQQLIRAH